MSCTECRDRLVALAENLLEQGEQEECRAHLQSCAVCRAELGAITRLQQQLLARGRSAATAGFTAAVMGRIHAHQKPERATIMSKLMKHRWGFGLGAAVGAAAMAVILSVAGWPNKAFGVEQVIAAYDHIRSLHVKDFRGNAAQPNEYWIQCNAAGLPEKARYDLPVTEDGEKLITWTPEKAEIWFKSKHGFLILQTSRIAPMMQNLLETSQPQVVLKKLREGQQAGAIEVQTREAEGSQTTELIIAIHTNKPQKEIYYVDRKTDLITRIEYFRLAGTNEILTAHTEFSDYNAPLEAKMFELQDQLPPDVTVADQLNQVTGVAQQDMTDEEAAEATVRQFFEALKNQDYKEAGLIYGGEPAAAAQKEFGGFTIGRIISVGPAEAQTNWNKRGFRVPCKLEITPGNGGSQFTSEPAPYVRPGDDEAHPDRWHITGGLSFGPEARVLPDNAKYTAMTPEQTARAFFAACSSNNWDEAGKFMPYLNDRLKGYLGGLKVISVGDSFTADKFPGGLAPGGFPGRFVPYEIQLSPQEIYVRVANTNAAKRWVLTGVYDGKRELEQDLKWSAEPEALADNDPDARLAPKETVQAYFNAQAKLDWKEMGKFTSTADVEDTKQQVAEGEKAGLDVRKQMPVFEVGEPEWVPEQSAWFVKCRVLQTKKWQLALRKDNPAGRWQVDGGI